MTMDAIMRRWPATIRVVLRHRMLCVGCPISFFHTLEDAAREHDLEMDALLRDIEAAIAAEENAKTSRPGPRRA